MVLCLGSGLERREKQRAKRQDSRTTSDIIKTRRCADVVLPAFPTVFILGCRLVLVVFTTESRRIVYTQNLGI